MADVRSFGVGALLIGVVALMVLVIIPALPDIPVVDRPAPEVPAVPVEISRLDTAGARIHVQERAHEGAVELLAALESGECVPDVYMEGECSTTNGDGRPAIMVCNVRGKRFFVSLRYDAWRGVWVAMTAFATDDAYIQRQVRKLNCHVADFTGWYVDFREVLDDSQ